MGLFESRGKFVEVMRFLVGEEGDVGMEGGMTVVLSRWSEEREEKGFGTKRAGYRDDSGGEGEGFLDGMGTPQTVENSGRRPRRTQWERHRCGGA